VATCVGQCSRALNDGRAGILVDPRSPGALATALEELLESPHKRKVFGDAFRAHVKSNYSRSAVIASLCRIYDSLCFPRSLAA
jgi:glycosyltransferase involved in cell wall biosynthesis